MATLYSGEGFLPIMQVRCEGSARVRHSGTGKEYKIASDELEWVVFEQRTENLIERIHQGSVTHPELGNLRWTLIEYPEENGHDYEGYEWADKYTTSNGHDVIMDFDYNLVDDDDTGAHEIETESYIDDLVEWFFENYEDPAEHTPYDSEEGGYQWIWGGPYDAKEVLQEHFGEVPEVVLEGAIERIERRGLEWAPKNDDVDYYDQDFEQLDIPEQEPGLGFALQPTGLIDIVPTGLADWAEQGAMDELRQATVSAVEALQTALRGTNAYEPLVQALLIYAAAIAAEPFSIDRSYSSGVYLEACYRRTRADINNGELPEFPVEIGAYLDTVLALQGPIVLGTDRGRQLVDDARSYSDTVYVTEAYRKVATDLVSVIASSGIVEARAVVQLSAVNTVVDTQHPERSAHVAHTANRNLLIEVVKTAFGLGVVAVLSSGVESSVVGLAASHAISVTIDLTTNFLLGHTGLLHDFIAASGADMNWLSAAIRSLTRKHA